MKTTLVVLAAGMGSRFGGLKQAAAITPNGRGILDFSCYDAKKAGFDDVVFIVRQDVEEEFKEKIGNRIASKMPVQYVIQDTTVLPEGRKKPFGTAHAILCCKDVVKNPFAVINSDDYYGVHAFKDLHDYLAVSKKGEYSMVPYLLGRTTSKNGTVTRGVCHITPDGYLSKVVETYNIAADGSYDDHGKRAVLPLDTPVSMNLWGLTPDIFEILEREYKKFLATADLMKDEFLIPTVIGDAVDAKEVTVKCFKNEDQWVGMTYREDLPEVTAAISKLIGEGLYEGI
jgi:NDP-sugar pyrophosphorylase family protein